MTKDDTYLFARYNFSQIHRRTNIFADFFGCSRFAFGIRCLRTFLTREKMLKSSRRRRRRNIIKQPKQQKVSLSERRIPQRKLFSAGLFRNFVQYFIRNEWTRKKVGGLFLRVTFAAQINYAGHSLDDLFCVQEEHQSLLY